MSGRGGSAAWEEALAHLRRLEEETARREEELWEAIEEIRDMLEAALRENLREGGGGRASVRQGGGRASAAPAAARADYRRMRRRFRRFATAAVPEGARAAVVSRGDDELLDLPRCEADHFPQGKEGVYAGYYPPDGMAAIAHLEAVRGWGAEYLLFPPSALWWLDSFPRFAGYLRRRYRVAGGDGRGGLAFDLRAPLSPAEAGWPARLAALLDGYRAGPSSSPSLLDWDTGLELASRLPGRTVFSPPEAVSSLPYMDDTVDLVALAGGDPPRLAEARRVARRGVVVFREEAGKGGAEEPPSLERLRKPPRPLPTASIVIPTYKGHAHLPACLRALQETFAEDFEGEVIVVDDLSADGTGDLLEEWAGRQTWLRVLRNPRNLGFVESCNRGAEAAEGEILVFLNDDTIPLDGWLTALLGTFRDRSDAGAVGGRLVYPDGRLQEAGCVVYNDGSGANFGRGDYEVDSPLYAYVRRAHYCSGALLATPRELFREAGGFDRRFRPAYYEDTDYCFSLRSAGLGIYYQPEAAVVHAEGATSGTDPERGAKRYQARNRERFRTKWRRVLEGLPDPPGRYSRLVWHRLAAEEVG